MKKLLSLCLFLSLLLSLSACPAPDDGSGNGGDTPTAGYTFVRGDDGRYTCEETGVTYRLSSSAYLPTEISELPYGAYTAKNGAVFSYFKIRDEDPAEYLAHADADDRFPYGILYSGENMPALPDMGVEDILICDADEEFFFRAANIFDRVGNLTVVSRAINSYRMAMPLEAAPTAKQALRVELIFLSSTYSFHYNLSYIQYEDGTAAFLDPADSRYYPAPFDLFDGYALSKDIET